MEVRMEDFRKHFASLSDEALLATRPRDLVDSARQCFEEELASRGLELEGPDPETTDEAGASSEGALVSVAEFDTTHEANFARDLLVDNGIPATLSNNPLTGLQYYSGSNVALLVPEEFADAARMILVSDISEEELAAQAEAAGAEGDPEPTED